MNIEIAALLILEVMQPLIVVLIGFTAAFLSFMTMMRLVVKAIV